MRKMCFKCRKVIYLDKEKYVLMGTYFKDEGLEEEQYFHWKCFLEWYYEKINEKVINIMKLTSEQALKFLKPLENIYGKET